MATAYRQCRATAQLLLDVDTMWPDRNRASDGWIGDAAHAARTSDHNPWVIDDAGVGVVTARDVTHDPDGPRGEVLAEIARLDRRTKYVIWDHQIASGGESWRPYYGENAHTKHVHVSVNAEPADYDDASSWLVVVAPSSSSRGPQMFLFTRTAPAAGIRLFTSAARPIPTTVPDEAAAEIGKALADPTYVARVGPVFFDVLVAALGE